MRNIHIKITKGLDLPVSGAPDQTTGSTNKPGQVALLGSDYSGMKPHFTVAVGDYVKQGQPLFVDRKRPSIQFTSPGSGTVMAINRGEKRALLSIVLRIEGNDEITFNSYPEKDLPSIDRNRITGLLLTSGLWTSIRSRPFSKIADPENVPHSLLITAMDTNPLAPSIPEIIAGKERDFINGLTVLSALTDGNVFLCKAPGDNIPYPEMESLSIAEFNGPHPAGNAGTHIHFLDPVSRNRQAWYINVQDVIATGVLFTTGRLNVERVISLAGPSVKKPRLIKTRIGASLDDITKGELIDEKCRTISGPVLSGHTASEETAYLGRYHQQVSVIPEEKKRSFLGWLSPGADLYSAKNIVLSRFLPGNKYHFTTSAHGNRRAIIPVEAYEKVMPLDIMPTHLLKALAVDDIEEAENLGCLELDEEDLALCTFVCPSKIDHGAELRRNLTLMEKEG
ncbi:MAG: Na(+)-translocating NADH-quinone reductase subunit A [Nitrospirota bacterium]